MNEELIQEIERRMLPHLNNEQLKELKSVLEDTLHGLTVLPSEDAPKPKERDAVDAFIVAKRIEGCSEKTLIYYRKTIETMISGIGKTPQQITTDDLRKYLTSYQVQRKSTMTYTERCYELMDELFALLERLKPISENGVKSFWLCARRGSIDDFGQQFGSYDDLLAEGDIKNYTEYETYWREMFPDEIEWYQLDAVEDKNSHYRAVLLKHQHVLEQEGSVRKSALKNDVSPFIEWLIESVRNSIEALEEGIYNELVEKNLPARHRAGTILRKDLWDLYPEGRAEYFENLSQEEVDEFVACAVSDKAQLKSKLPAVTANDFYRFCAMGYKANNYAGSELSSREQYFKHADGRDSGLGEIDPDSPTEFSTWYHDSTRHGGHPWEVCRGGNSTHVDLYVVADNDGYSLHVAGSSTWRSVEAIKFFLALHRAGLPVVISQAELLKSRLLGMEKVGIVPVGVWPAYCQSRFPNEDVEAFINLPRENEEKMIPRCVWQPLTQIELQ